MSKYQQELEGKVKKYDNVFIADNARVLGNMVVSDGSMVLGTSGKIVKTLPIEIVKANVMHGVEEYLKEAKKYLEK